MTSQYEYRGGHAAPAPSWPGPCEPVRAVDLDLEAAGRKAATLRMMVEEVGRPGDVFFLLAHDEVTGRLQLAERIAGLAAAGALLAELVLAGLVAVQTGDLVAIRSTAAARTSSATAISRSTLADDPLLRGMLDVISDEVKRPVRDWLAFFGRDAIEKIAERLSRAGVVARRPSRLPLRAGKWVTTDPNTSAMSVVRLCHELVTKKAGPRAAVLAGLARATDLEHRHPGLFEIYDRPDTQVYIDRLLAESAPPMVRELLGQIVAATAAAVGSLRP